MRILIKNGKVLLFENERFQVAERDLIIEGDRVRAICPRGEADFWLADQQSSASKQQGFGSDQQIPASGQKAFDKVLDAQGCLVMPGLINAHTHAYMSLFRNYADDLEFFDWLSKVQAVEDQTTIPHGYWGTMLSILEMIRTGTTSFVDMNMYSTLTGALKGPESACAGAVNESGIRGFLSRGLVGESRASGDEGAVRRFREFYQEMELYRDHSRIQYLLGPHAPYSCGQSLLREIRAEGLFRKMRATIHLSESETEVSNMASQYEGKTPVQYVADTGLFDLPVIAAHCVQVTDADIRILKEHGVHIAINPRSNMKLGNGFAPVEKFLQAGLNVCLGTDGSGSNNTQNMFQEMQMAALVYKGAAKKAKCVDAQEVLRFATVNGAKALGMEGELGVIAEGALADLILVDLHVPQFMPQNNIVSGLVYAANGSEVRTVMVGGQLLMEDRKLLTINEDQVYESCEAITKSLGMKSI